MRTLTYSEISRFSSLKGVRKTAVENFLSSMGTDYTTAVENLKLDITLYKWEYTTSRAILQGIMLAMRPR